MSAISTQFGSSGMISRSNQAVMARTLAQISSGRAVSSASDNAAYWSISTVMSSDSKALSAVSDALSLGAATTDTASLGMTKSLALMDDIKQKLVLARQDGADKTRLNTEISGLKEQLASTVQSASFSGVNLLTNTTGSAPGKVEMVSGFTRSANGDVTVTVSPFDKTTTTLMDTLNPQNGILTGDVTVNQPHGPAQYHLLNGASVAPGTEITLSANTSAEDIDGMISAVDSMMSKMTGAATALGAHSSGIKANSELTARIRDSIDKGIASLVDTDMGEQSARLAAVTVQIQLQGMMQSIANANAKTILDLFR